MNIEKGVTIVEINDILSKRFIFFDGAMGTMLQSRGLIAGEIPEIYNILYPDIIKEIHQKYIEAGSDIITTNTFGANELKLKDTKYSVEEVITKAVEIAKEAKKAKSGKYIALDVGPIGQMLEPIGILKFERAYEIFKRQIEAGVKAGCDLILIETISDLYEAKAAVLAAKENSNLPVFCTMTFGEDGRTFTGTDPLTMVTLLEGLGVDALGVNCSLGPKELIPIVEKILQYSSTPVIVQANAGLPRVENGKTIYDITPEEFSQHVKAMAQRGACILGGCCGTTDKYIKMVIDSVKDLKPLELNNKKLTAICSSSKTVVLGEEVKIIGERINPTGKKKFKDALKSNNIDYILTEAISQVESGADVLDVNVGMPEIHEREMMIRAIKEIQSILNVPLQIDSADEKVIEAAVRIYNGKPIINSVNGKEQVMKEIFPIAKRYGACIVGLTLDENGIPSKAEERFKIAEKIINTAKEYGINKEDILIDCLVLTASAQQKEVMETVKAVRMVKEKLEVSTVLGVSNVSFGLPKREILNQTFLSMTLAAGLDAPILNPGNKEVMDIIKAFKVLSNIDREAKEYVNTYSNIEVKELTKVNNDRDLKEIIIKGLKEDASESVRKLLGSKDSLTIVDEYLIPALDVVGKKYEEGEIFLPQLIQSAETVKNAFAVIKENISLEENKQVSKGKIILATVKGDIHDIGKNIVKVILENYGFDIIDLGKDVSVENIVETAKRENVKLVGLSALMTTTVKSMEDTIKSLRENKVKCKIFVGGAVLNQEYADMIKADYYAKDAQEAARIAQDLFQNTNE